MVGWYGQRQCSHWKTGETIWSGGLSIFSWLFRIRRVAECVRYIAGLIGPGDRKSV